MSYTTDEFVVIMIIRFWIIGNCQLLLYSYNIIPIIIIIYYYVN